MDPLQQATDVHLADSQPMTDLRLGQPVTAAKSQELTLPVGQVRVVCLTARGQPHLRHARCGASTKDLAMPEFDSPSSLSGSQDPTTTENPSPGSPAHFETSRTTGAGTTSSSSGADSTTAVATEQAKQVGQEAVDSSKQVAAVAAGQAKSVAAEAGAQARNLLDEARSQLTEQARSQQNNLAGWLQSLVEELDEMVDRSGDSRASEDTAASLVRQVADRARQAAGWLEQHEPADLVSETSRFARQRPGLFLALAAAAGLLAGRLTRGLTADSHTQSPGAVGSAGRSGSVPPSPGRRLRLPPPPLPAPKHPGTTTHSATLRSSPVPVKSRDTGTRDESRPGLPASGGSAQGSTRRWCGPADR
jgi:ElaB/YqjD/DUF883 family membrane-anchored ribosome-binding protein